MPSDSKPSSEPMLNKIYDAITRPQWINVTDLPTDLMVELTLKDMGKPTWTTP